MDIVERFVVHNALLEPISSTCDLHDGILCIEFHRAKVNGTESTRSNYIPRIELSLVHGVLIGSIRNLKAEGEFHPPPLVPCSSNRPIS